MYFSLEEAMRSYQRRSDAHNLFRPRSKEHREDEIFPGLLLRLEGGSCEVPGTLNAEIAGRRPVVNLVEHQHLCCDHLRPVGQGGMGAMHLA